MKLLLTTLNSKYIHSNLALRYLYSCAADKMETELKEFTINEELFKILGSINDIGADIIAFSCYIWNITQTAAICECIKKVKPETIIILGGPEVSHDTEEFLKENKFIDYILMGEGEENFPMLLSYILNEKNNLSDIPGLAYKGADDLVCINNPAGVIKDLSIIKSPYITDFQQYKNKVIYYESSRGCPYNCSYCLSATTKGVRYFPMERVKDDLKRLIDAGVGQVKFVDRTFNSDKKRALEIWQYLLANRKDTTFHFEISAHLIDDTMLEFLKEVPKGFFQFEIGVQSTNKETITAINRVTDFQTLSYIVKKIVNMNNIHIHLDLIAGLPYESYERFKKSFDDVYALNPHVLQLGFLKLLKGSPIRESHINHGYKWTRLPTYEILENSYISYDEILKLKMMEEVVETYKNSGRFEHSLNFIISKYYNSSFEFFDELSQYWKSIGVYDRKLSGEEAFDVLFDFYCKKEWNDKEYLQEILKLDFCLGFFGTPKRKWANKYTIPNIKETISELLFNKEFVEKYTEGLKDASWSEKMKVLSFEVFRFNVLAQGNEGPAMIILQRKSGKNIRNEVTAKVISPEDLKIEKIITI